jgi:phosphonate transport system substrate-binding protein
VPAITFAAVPSSLLGDRRVAMDALCAALAGLLRCEVTGVLPDSYADLAQLLERDRVQYAWMSPALMVLTSERIQLQPLLSAVRNDRNDYCAALFVDAAGPAHDLEALRGRTVAWVDPASAAGYLVPRIHLAANGVDPSDLFGEELFLGSHAEVVRAVVSGRAALGATYAEQPAAGEPVRRAGFLDVAPDHPMRVLEWTQPIPNDVIVGHGLIAKAEHRVFGNAVLTLAERVDGRRLLYNMFHTERFMTTPRNALRSLWTLVEVARARGLLAQM